MITSSSIPYISQMLNEPHAITDADVDSIVSLTETYPYFVPARYMEAAGLHKHKPFDADMMNTMQLYMGNWIVFHEYMQTALGKDYVFAPVSTPAPADVDDVAEAEIAGQQVSESIWSQDDEEEDAIVDEQDEILIAADEEEEELVAEEEQEVAGEYNEDYLDEEELDVHDEEYEAFADEDEEEITIAAEAEEENIPVRADNDEALILPIYTEDYFLHQGIQVSNNIPAVDKQTGDLEMEAAAEDPKSLMIVMSYADWLNHFKTHGEKAREEEQDQKALKTMWQKEKLAAALEEENEEIPENVFEMAVNSITKEDGLLSESLADIYQKQGKYDAAIDMYKKLSLRNPRKSAYFARKVEEILKDTQP